MKRTTFAILFATLLASCTAESSTVTLETGYTMTWETFKQNDENHLRVTLRKEG